MAISTTPAGTHTSIVPTAGTSEATAVATPKKIGSGSPAIH
jgi:hypothetical protein